MFTDSRFLIVYFDFLSLHYSLSHLNDLSRLTEEARHSFLRANVSQTALESRISATSCLSNLDFGTWNCQLFDIYHGSDFMNVEITSVMHQWLINMAWHKLGALLLMWYFILQNSYGGRVALLWEQWHTLCLCILFSGSCFPKLYLRREKKKRKKDEMLPKSWLTPATQWPGAFCYGSFCWSHWPPPGTSGCVNNPEMLCKAEESLYLLWMPYICCLAAAPCWQIAALMMGRGRVYFYLIIRLMRDYRGWKKQ